MRRTAFKISVEALNEMLKRVDSLLYADDLQNLFKNIPTTVSYDPDRRMLRVYYNEGKHEIVEGQDTPEIDISVRDVTGNFK